MGKGIMKNDKAGDDLQSNLLAGDIQNIMLRYSDTYVIEVSDAIARYIKLHYTAKEIKPTTDIDEVRKAFRDTFGVAYQIQKINDIEENVLAMDVNYVDIDRVFDFFLPYLKGGE